MAGRCAAVCEQSHESSVGGATALQGYVRASEAEAYKKELEALHAQADGQTHAAEAQVAEQVNKFKADYQKKLQFDYTLDKNAAREPFLVSTIYHDEAFTYTRQTLGYRQPHFAGAAPRADTEAGPWPGDVDIPGGRFLLGAPPDAPSAKCGEGSSARGLG